MGFFKSSLCTHNILNRFSFHVDLEKTLCFFSLKMENWESETQRTSFTVVFMNTFISAPTILSSPKCDVVILAWKSGSTEFLVWSLILITMS
ncbi:hypothetical protein Y1Q_0008292 [Alligator mississippiensis]|uniref:Uncharacterized protein n=1 Tax=Alligator mississippiensis TaxID=8496 RepID=A0A151N1Y8_ALLMI|nr:hypothetical protein Y1Q_0008292 [Alligator mississippiensis]